MIGTQTYSNPTEADLDQPLRPGDLRRASLDDGAELDGNPFHEQSAGTFVKVLRTWREPLPATPLRRIPLAEQHDDFLLGLARELGFPGMPNEALQWWGV
jgi:hypothetical protein